MDLGDTAQSQDNTTVLSWVLLPVRQGAGRNSGGGGGRGGGKAPEPRFPSTGGRCHTPAVSSAPRDCSPTVPRGFFHPGMKPGASLGAGDTLSKGTSFLPLCFFGAPFHIPLCGTWTPRMCHEGNPNRYSPYPGDLS